LREEPGFGAFVELPDVRENRLAPLGRGPPEISPDVAGIRLGELIERQLTDCALRAFKRDAIDIFALEAVSRGLENPIDEMADSFYRGGDPPNVRKHRMLRILEQRIDSPEEISDLSITDRATERNETVSRRRSAPLAALRYPWGQSALDEQRAARHMAGLWVSLAQQLGEFSCRVDARVDLTVEGGFEFGANRKDIAWVSSNTAWSDLPDSLSRPSRKSCSIP